MYEAGALVAYWQLAACQHGGEARSYLLRRMIDLSKRQIHIDSHLRLNVEFRADLNWWHLLCTWNGVSVVAALCRRPIDAKVTSDASGSWGCGAFCNQRWFNLSWDSCPSWTDVHITVDAKVYIVIGKRKLYNIHSCHATRRQLWL